MSSSWAQGVACLDVGFPMRYSHSALEVLRPGRPRRRLSRLTACRAVAASAPTSLNRATAMSYTLGIDIGTFESKGVLVDGDGTHPRHGHAARTR